MSADKEVCGHFEAINLCAVYSVGREPDAGLAAEDMARVEGMFGS